MQPLVALVGLCIYRRWFHPLAAFPGPALYAVTDLPQHLGSMVRGTWHKQSLELHRRYGPVVRVGPNSLIMDGSIAWPQVYGRQPGGLEYSKLRLFFGPENAASIISAPRDDHRRQRRHLAHAFSEAALVEQRDFVMKHLNLLIRKIAEHAHEGRPLNAVDWMNFMTFDVIGDLGFGDSFGSLDRGDYHPWVRIITDALPGFALARLVTYYPVLKPVFPLLGGQKFINQMRTLSSISDAKTDARIAAGEQPGRRDFITYVNRKTRSGEDGMTPEEKRLTGQILIVAGSETTSSTLAASFFFLGHHPEALARLRAEIRGAYAAEADVDMKNVPRLAYLSACIEETLRLYPPGVEIPPRVSPGAEVDGKFVPAGVSLPPAPPRDPRVLLTTGRPRPSST